MELSVKTQFLEMHGCLDAYLNILEFDIDDHDVDGLAISGCILWLMDYSIDWPKLDREWLDWISSEV